MGVRSIQFLAIVVVLPVVLILALEGILERSAVGALIGALVGYLFTNIGKYDERKAGKGDVVASTQSSSWMTCGRASRTASS